MHSLVRRLPNALTVARAAALPFVVWTYWVSGGHAAWVTAGLVLAAALTDVADGAIARRHGAQSEFGRWADPIVDRAFFFTLIAMLLSSGVLPWWAAVPLLVRDGVILALAVPVRRYTTEGPQVSRWGKAGNLVLLCAVLGFLLGLTTVAWILFAVGGGLYVATGLLYGYRAVAWAAGRSRRAADERSEAASA